MSALHERARALLDVQRPGDVLALLAPAVAVEPEDAEAWLLLGVARLRTDDADGALEAASTAASLDPGDHRAALVASSALVRLRRGEQAVVAAAEAVRLVDDEASRTALVMALLADGEGRRARETAQDSVRADPTAAGAWVALARVSAATSWPDQALAAYDRALALDPADPDVASERAALAAERDLAGGLRELSRAAGTDASRATSLLTTVEKAAGERLVHAAVALLVTLGAIGLLLGGQGATGGVAAGLLSLPGVVVAASRLVPLARLEPALRTHLQRRVTSGLQALCSALLAGGAAAVAVLPWLPVGLAWTIPAALALLLAPVVASSAGGDGRRPWWLDGG